MIFEKIFAPKYKHKDPLKRIAAIQAIDHVDASNRSWLHELAFNDENIDARVMALKKLNTFSLWLKSFEESRDERLRSIAKQSVIDLAEDEDAVEDTLFRDLVTNPRYTDIALKLRQSSVRLLKNNDLLLASLFVYGNQGEISRFYRERAIPAQQSAIVQRYLTDEKMLKRLRKHTKAPEIIEYIDQQLNEIKRLAELPVILIQQGKLLNAQLNALLDSQEYAYIERKKDQIVAEFNGLKGQFVALNEADAAELTNKFLTLKSRIDQRLNQLLPAYQAQQELRLLSDRQDSLRHQLSEIEEQVNLFVEGQQDDTFDAQRELLLNALNDANETFVLLDSDLNDIATLSQRTKQRELAKKINTIRATLDNIGFTLRQNAQLNQAIENLQKIWQSHEQGQSSIDELRDSLHQITSSIDNIEYCSESIVSCYQAQNDLIQRVLNEDEKHQEQLTRRCMSKLNVVSGLVGQGKFKAAIGAFTAAQEFFESLRRPTRSVLKKFTDVSNEIKNLKDWQDYIAAPKKPLLLESAKALIGNEALSIAERSAKIKQLRTEWNSLSMLDPHSDSELTQEFDRILEQAFEPCREYYAARDKERAQNAQQASGLLDQLATLNELEDDTEVLQQFNRLTQQFHQIKDLDHSVRRQLQQRLKSVSAPLKQRVNAMYLGRETAKKNLIHKANRLLDESDLDQAAEQAKALQQEWRLIGFAGKPAENELWQQFRQINDQIFARLTQYKKQQQESSNEAFQQLLSTLHKISERDYRQSSVSELNAALDAIAQTTAQQDQLTRSQAQKIAQQASQLERRISQALLDQELSERKRSLAEFIDQLLAFTSSENKPNAPTSLLRQSIEHALAAHEFFDTLSRPEIFNTMLFLIDAQFKLNKDIQLRLMACRLEGRTDLTVAIAFAHWVSRGPLHDEDKRQLTSHRQSILDAVAQLLD